MLGEKPYKRRRRRRDVSNASTALNVGAVVVTTIVAIVSCIVNIKLVTEANSINKEATQPKMQVVSKQLAPVLVPVDCDTTNGNKTVVELAYAQITFANQGGRATSLLEATATLDGVELQNNDWFVAVLSFKPGDSDSQMERLILPIDFSSGASRVLLFRAHITVVWGTSEQASHGHKEFLKAFEGREAQFTWTYRFSDGSIISQQYAVQPQVLPSYAFFSTLCTPYFTIPI